MRFNSDPCPQHLILQFEDLDIEVPEIRTPLIEDVAAAINFAHGVNGRLLIHCFAGISRSTAIALAIIASEMPKGSEQKALSALLELAPSAVPNLLIIKHADDILELNGALVSAIRNWDAGLAYNQRRRALNKTAILSGHAQRRRSAV